MEVALCAHCKKGLTPLNKPLKLTVKGVVMWFCGWVCANKWAKAFKKAKAK